jgi:hypothetical protein
MGITLEKFQPSVPPVLSKMVEAEVTKLKELWLKLHDKGYSDSFSRKYLLLI